MKKTDIFITYCRCSKKRYVGFSEPDKEETIQVGFMKELTGGETIQARGLHKDPIYFKPQFKMILACNDLPVIPSTDGGTWRRLRVVEFSSEFKDEHEYDPSNPRHYKKDAEIENIYENVEIRQHFMAMLLEIYKKYKQDGLKEPYSVMEYTRQFQRDSDSYLEFIEELVEKTGNNSDSLTIDMLYSSYKEWYTNVHSNKPPSKKVFTDNIVKHLGKAVRGKGYTGIKFKQDEDVQSDDDI